MVHVNYRSAGEGAAGVHFTLGALGKSPARGHESDVRRVAGLTIGRADFETLSAAACAVGVTDRFRDVIRTFGRDHAGIPAGFRVETSLAEDGLLSVDLVRDIGYDRDGVKRPSGMLFSADSANPYEIEPVAGVLANLTCNPGIVYDLFLNDPAANVGQKFGSLEEVMQEIGALLGPGCDISVEIEDPFAELDVILDQMARYREILSEYRLVVKVPHTGPVNGGNATELLHGDRRLRAHFARPSVEDAFRSHTLALALREHGYRVNYTLMFEPHQTALALQAKPYFINSFVRHRLGESRWIAHAVEAYRTTRDVRHLEALRSYLVDHDHLSSTEADTDLIEVLEYAEDLVAYRRIEDPEGHDGLDGVRHNLRLLKATNLPDTRLIVCSMEGRNYRDLDKLATEPEFADVVDRLVVTAEPAYLARFTSASQVVSYQRRFLNAVPSSGTLLDSA
ncbi:transaldolase [Pseudonocardia sp. C8]|nr:transaldolase [Pseudonocardia sp. C8]